MKSVDERDEDAKLYNESKVYRNLRNSGHDNGSARNIISNIPSDANSWDYDEFGQKVEP